MGVKLKMKSFVAVLACLSAASAAVLPAGVVGSYAYPHAYGYTAAAPVAYAGQPIAYNTAPAAVLGGVYGAAYDPSVAYANLYPVAEPYVHEDIAAEPYVDAQIEAEPYVHEEIAAEAYVHAEIPAEAYVDVQVPAEAYIHQEPIVVAAPVVAYNYAAAPVAAPVVNYNYAAAPVAAYNYAAAPVAAYNYAAAAPAAYNYNFGYAPVAYPQVVAQTA